MHSIDGSIYRDGSGITAAIFPFPAFERLQEVSAPVLSSLFAYHPAGNVNVMIKGEADLARGQYVSGDFFRGLAVSPAAGRLIVADDDRAGAPPAVVISMGYSQRRFGGAAEAAGQPILINNVRVHRDRRHAARVLWRRSRRGARRLSSDAGRALCSTRMPRHKFLDPNYYWLQMMGRLRPGVSRAQAQAALGTPFEQWVTPDRDKRSGARQSSRASPRGRRGWTRQPQAPGTRSRSTCCWRWSA